MWRRFRGNRRTKLEEPAPYALVGNIQTPLSKKILHIPIAQSEPGIEPNGASNDFRWKAVTFEGDGVHPKRLHRNHQIEIRALNVTMPPWSIVLVGCPNALEAYAEVGWKPLMISNLFAIGWGVANVLYGICVVRIGAALDRCDLVRPRDDSRHHAPHGLQGDGHVQPVAGPHVQGGPGGAGRSGGASSRRLLLLPWRASAESAS